MLRALLLLPGLLGAVLAGPMPGPQACAEGLAARCQDLQTATRCGAVGHCQRAVWSKPAARSLPCSVCLDVVAAASDGLDPDAAETNVLALVTKTCEWLPSWDSVSRCKAAVDAHSSAILSMIWGSPGSAPAPVCAALTLCQPLQTAPATAGPLSEDAPKEVAPLLANGPLSFHPPQIPGDAVCQDCVRLVTRLQEAVEANVSRLAEETTQEQCAALGPGLAPLCRNYVIRFLAPAEQTLRLVVPEETCRRRGFCEAPLEPARRAQLATEDGVPLLEVTPWMKNEVQMKAGPTCEVCLQVVQELDQWLESNSTEAMISHALGRLCSVMPDTIAQQCVAMVDAYSPSLVQMVTRVTPDQVCKTVRLCGGARRQTRELHWPRGTTAPPPVLDSESQGSFCNGCKRLLGVSSRSLERKSTRRNLLAAFKGGCSILPLPYMIQCNRFVNEYEPVLLATLMEMMEPTALCTKMGACHPARTPLLGSDQCVMGPSFWCESQESAEMCDAVDHCQRHMWK